MKNIKKILFKITPKNTLKCLINAFKQNHFNPFEGVSKMHF